ncbi:DNA-binding protein [Psychrobacillus phage Perkons]|nr:DNA-binding protein [Psychrobacillus phage Perkons]
MANKTELTNKAQEKLEVLGTKVNKDVAASYVDVVLESIKELTAEHGKLQLIGFGNFEVRERAARKGRNPQDGSEIDIEAKRVPAFKPLKGFKDLVK